MKGLLIFDRTNWRGINCEYKKMIGDANQASSSLRKTLQSGALARSSKTFPGSVPRSLRHVSSSNFDFEQDGKEAAPVLPLPV